MDLVTDERRKVMHAWEQIQKVVDYIEEHLDETTDINKLADMAALSPFYFQRLFKRLVKRPVADYIKQRRMGAAIKKLQSDQKILDIAIELGFSSHEHFTKIFKESYGMTPQEYRKNPVTLNYVTKPELLLNYVLIDEGVPIITNGIVLEINRKTISKPIEYIGFEMRFPATVLQRLGVEPGVDPLAEPWDKLHAEKPNMTDLFEGEEELGVMYAEERPDYFAYFSGVRKKTGTDGSKYFSWNLPVGEYLVCVIEAKDFESLVMDALYKANDYLYGVFIPKHEIKTGPINIERYTSHAADETAMEIWLPIEK